MITEHQLEAKRQVIAALQNGQGWKAATTQAGITMGRSTAYRLARRVRLHGEQAYTDQRHGHPSKCRQPVRAWLVDYWQRHPEMPASRLQEILHQEQGIRLSIGHLNALRRQCGLGLGKKAGA